MTVGWNFHKEGKALDKKCFRKYDELDCLSCVLIPPSSGVLPMVNVANIFRQVFVPTSPPQKVFVFVFAFAFVFVFVPTSPPQVVALITEYWSENEEVDARFFFFAMYPFQFPKQQQKQKLCIICEKTWCMFFFAGDGPY